MGPVAIVAQRGSWGPCFFTRRGFCHISTAAGIGAS